MDPQDDIRVILNNDRALTIRMDGNSVTNNEFILNRSQ